MDDRDLMNARVDTLFTYDARGRMVRDNEPHGRPAPRLFVGRTLHGDVVRFGETVPDTVVERLTALLAGEPPAPELRQSPSVVDALREALERHSPVTGGEDGPAFRFPDGLTEPAGLVRVADENVDLVQAAFPRLFPVPAARYPCVAIVRDGVAVSVCFASRVGAQVMEAGVETLPDFRGRGYAAAVTVGWGLAVRAAGRIPLYSTSWGNVASQGVARRVGLIMYGVDWSWW